MATVARIDEFRPTDFAPESVAQTYIERAKALRDLLRSEAAEGERLRSPTPTVDKALKENDLLTLLLPQRWGGAGLSFTDYARVQMELAKGDTSISWVSQIVNGTTWVASLTSDATQETLFGSGPNLVCGAYNPPGKARRVEGGWIVNGAWPYTSGSRQAAWAQAGCVLEGYEGPVVPGINMVYIPMSQIQMRDTWFMSGMQGTGSDTSVAVDAFVPDHLMVMMDKPFGHVEPGKRHYGAPSDCVPVVPVVRATGLAQLVGAAEAMLEIVEAEGNKPIVTTTYASRKSSGVVLHDLGRVAAQLGTAKLLLLDATATLDDVGLTGRDFPHEERAKHKAQCAQIVELVHESIETLMFISGSSAFALDKPISRFWRDVHVGLRHVQNVPMLGYEIFGRSRLGVDNISPPGAY